MLPDARVGPPLNIVMNNPEVPNIHGTHNLQTDLFFISIYTVVGNSKDRILPRTQPHPHSCALLRRSRRQQKGVCVHMAIYGGKAAALDVSMRQQLPRYRVSLAMNPGFLTPFADRQTQNIWSTVSQIRIRSVPLEVKIGGGDGW